MAETEIVKSVCGLCSGCCGVLIHLEDGKPVKIVGDPESPLNRGALCRKCLTSLSYLDHPDRVTAPLKRVGERGAGKWQKISWDEAFSITADALNGTKAAHGPDAVFMAHGSAKAFIDTDLVRLANAFGTPNVISADHVCHVPRMLGAEFTFGFYPVPEMGHPPACIFAWGVNHAETRFYKYKGWLDAKDRGSKLIVVDPFETQTASAADLWLQLRPGTDLALALGIIHVLIKEGLFDRTFVDTWTVGFEQLEAHLQAYSPEKVSDITWVPADTIVEAARLYGESRPGYIEFGNALDHTMNSFQVSRALSILMALTGDLDAPGGEIELAGTGFRFGDTESSAVGILGRWSYELELRDQIPREKRKNKIDPDLLPDFRYVTPQTFERSVLEGKPYPIRAGFVQAANPLSSWSNVKKADEALRHLEFLAVSDMFITATAALADIVFPVASYLEYDGIQMPPPPGSFIAECQRKVAQVGECRSDIEIINGLAKRLGLGANFWESGEGFWDYVLKPTGLTFEAFKEKGRLMANLDDVAYWKYKEKGFKTPSGKVEFYSQQLEGWGFDPLPEYREPPDTAYGNPEMAKTYPLICTCRKVAPYRHSLGQQIPALRDGHPEPVVNFIPQTAEKLSLEEGDWVNIETGKGKIKQKVNVFSGIDPRVVVADYAWCFPETGTEESYGWSDSNYNVLTGDAPNTSPEVGSPNIRGFACKIYKAPEGH